MRWNIVLAMFLALASLSNFVALAGTWSDGFEDPDLDDEWKLHVQVGNQPIWEMENGLLIADQNGQSSLRVGDNEWKGYSVEVTITLLEDRNPGPGATNSRYAGIAMLVKIVNHGYFFGIYRSFWDGRGPELLIGVFDGWQPPIASKYEPLKVKLNREYKLRMAEEENVIKCYLDGKLINELAMDKRFTSGTVGIAVCNMRSVFDDFIVTGDNVPDGGPGLGRAVELKNKLATTWGETKQAR